MRDSRTFAALVVMTWATLGCECGSEPSPDAGLVDAGSDAGAQSDAGSPPDGGVDAGLADAGVDAGLDAGFDAGLDAGLDAGVDAGSPIDAGPPPFCAAQWCWSNPLPQGNQLNAVFAASPSDVWAVGDRGTTLHFDGARWTVDPTDPSLYFSGVFAPTASRVWAVAGRVSYLVFDGGSRSGLLSGAIVERDAGAWSALEFDVGFTGISGTSATDVWAVAYDGGLHFDGGSWQPSLPPGLVTSVWATSPTDAWAFGPVVRRWDGTSWSAVTAQPSVVSVWASGPDDAWAVTDGAALSRWDGGVWATSFTTFTGQTRVWGTAQNDVWAAGDGFPILHFDGSGWAPTQTTASVRGLGGTSRTDAWAVGGSGTILHWDGTDWRPHSKNAAGPLGFSCTALWAATPTDLWAMGGGTILHGDGTGWTKVTSPRPTANIYALWGSSPSDVWAVGEVAMHWNGTAWSVPATSPSMSALAIWGSSANDVWVAGIDLGTFAGRLARWDGTRWNAVVLATPFFPAGLWGTGPNDVWLASSLGSMLHWDGATWSTASTFEGTEGVWFGAANDVWSWNSGTAQFVHWNGTTWASFAPPIAGADFYGFAGSGPQDVWAHGYDRNTGSGVIARWRGAQWELDPSPALPQLGAIASPGPGEVWLGGHHSALVHRRP